ncbi:MAG: transposase, partial [Trueperaceae bacterium]|nr:transposase [Trueperaceae bacterium]
MKRFIPFDPDQPLLLPPDLREALPAGHTALLLLDVVEELDLSEVHAGVAEEQWGGKPGFDPRVMVRVWIYAYAVGLRSSRKVQQALIENVAFRVVANNQTPGYWALNRFRTQHRVALGNLLAQTVTIAMDLGLVKLGNVAIDGTKVRGNASKHKAMSYERMLKSELELEAEIKELLEQAEAADQDEAKTPEVGGWDERLPEELRLRQ